MRSSRWLPPAVLIVAFTVLALVWHFGPKSSTPLRPIPQRRPMPDLTLAELGGGTWRMADHRGQVVLVNYWATWCGPCWQETPALVELSHELGPQGFAVVGIALDPEHRPQIESFVSRLHVTYPIALTENLSQIESGLQAVPTSLLIDRHGRVAKSYLGAIGRRELAQDVHALLTEP